MVEDMLVQTNRFYAGFRNLFVCCDQTNCGSLFQLLGESHCKTSSTNGHSWTNGGKK